MVDPSACRAREELHHRLAVLRVEVAGRLVGEQDRGLARNRASHRHPLLLAPGELAREMPGAMGHLYLREGLVHPLPPLGRPHAPVGQGQLDVLVDGEVAYQVEALEDEADLAVPGARAGRYLEARHGPAVEPVLTVGRRVEQPENRQQRRLSAAGGSRDGDVLPGVDVEVDLREGMGLDLVGEEDLRHLVEANERLGCVVHWLDPPSSVRPAVAPATPISAAARSTICAFFIAVHDDSFAMTRRLCWFNARRIEQLRTSDGIGVREAGARSSRQFLVPVAAVAAAVGATASAARAATARAAMAATAELLESLRGPPFPLRRRRSRCRR